MSDDIKHKVSLETLTQVRGYHREYGCLLETLGNYDNNNVFCNQLSVIGACSYRVGKTTPKPICMCWVKREILVKTHLPKIEVDEGVFHLSLINTDIPECYLTGVVKSFLYHLHRHTRM